MTIILAIALAGLGALAVAVVALALGFGRLRREVARFQQVSGTAILELQFARLNSARDSSITGRHSRPMAFVEPGPS